MPRKRRKSGVVQLDLVGDLKLVATHRQGDSRFVESFKALNPKPDHKAVNSMIVPMLREKSRVANTGKAVVVGVRIKADAFDSVRRRAAEVGMTVGEYVRSLITHDIGVPT